MVLVAHPQGSELYFVCNAVVAQVKQFLKRVHGLRAEL